MVLIKSKIYFREILNSEKDLFSALKSDNKEVGERHIKNILHFFIKSGYNKLVFYVLEKLKDIKPDFDVVFSAVLSKKIDIIKLACKYFKFYDIEKITDLAKKYYMPEVFDFFIQKDERVFSLEFFREPSLFNYFCGQENIVCFRCRPILLIKSNIISPSETYLGEIIYRFIRGKIIKCGYW